MCMEQDHGSDDVLDATALAEKLSISPEYLRRRMRIGLVTSRVETGDAALTRNITCTGLNGSRGSPVPWSLTRSSPGRTVVHQDRPGPGPGISQRPQGWVRC